MENQTNGQAPETEPAANQQAERTFTQEELDAIVKDRISQVKGKYSDYATLKEKADKFDAAAEANKSDLQKETERADALQKELDEIRKADTVRNVREKVSRETGVPAALLTGDSEDNCSEQAKAIMEFAKSQGYPAVRDGGEVTKVSSSSTRDQFANWMRETLQK